MLIYDIISPKKEIKQIPLLSLKKFRRANKKMPRKILPSLLSALLIIQMFLPVQMFFDPPRVEMREASAYGNGWLDGWDYRTPIEIDGNTEDLTDYQVQITLQGRKRQFQIQIIQEKKKLFQLNQKQLLKMSQQKKHLCLKLLSKKILP